MPISQKRLDEIASIADDEIDTSEIPEADDAWFREARVVVPREAPPSSKPLEATKTSTPVVADPGSAPITP